MKRSCKCQCGSPIWRLMSRTAFRSHALACLVVALAASAPAYLAAQSRAAVGATKPTSAAGPRTRNVPAAGAKLDMLVRLQSAALEEGDPARIASRSRELDAELLNLLGTISAGKGRTDDAIAFFRESLALKPSVESQIRLSTLLARAGRFSDATTVAEAAVQAAPRDARTYSSLGSTLRTAGRNAEAVDVLTRALELDPDPSVAFALGSALLAIHDKARADQIFSRILNGSHGAAIWHVAVGDAYREADYLKEAAAEFRAALAKDPRAKHAEFFLGLVSLQMNEWGPNSESFLHLRKSVEQNPREYLSNFYLGALEATDGTNIADSDRHLLAAVRADPTQPEAWIYLGQNANREHRLAEAITDFRKAIALTGNDEARNHYQVRRAYFALGRLLIAQDAKVEGEKYLADYKRTAALDAALASRTVDEKQGAAMHPSAAPGPPPGDALRVLASVGAAIPISPAIPAQEQAMGISHLHSAEAQLRLMLGNGFNDLGTAEARQQQYVVALHDFQQAERFVPPSAALLKNIALAASRVNDSAEVRRSLNAYFATQPAPVDPLARAMLAMANFDGGRFQEAVQAFRSAGEGSTGDSRLAYAYAYSLARTGQAREAAAIADTLAASGLPADRLSLVCNVYFTGEDYKSAQDCYQRVAVQDPALPRAHYFVGESLIHMDRPAEAVTELQRELLLTPDEPNVQSSLAFALAQTGRKAEAQALLTQALAAHPEHAESQYQLGKLLAEQGNTADSITHLEASVKEDPSKDYAHYQLAMAYRKSGRSGEAEREFEAYRSIKGQKRGANVGP